MLWGFVVCLLGQGGVGLFGLVCFFNKVMGAISLE